MVSILALSCYPGIRRNNPPTHTFLHFLLPCSSLARLLSSLLSSRPSISSFWRTETTSQLQATCMTPLRRGQVICHETLDQAPASTAKCRSVALEKKPCSGSSYYSLLLKNEKKPQKIHHPPIPLPPHPQQTCIQKHVCSKHSTKGLYQAL